MYKPLFYKEKCELQCTDQWLKYSSPWRVQFQIWYNTHERRYSMFDDEEKDELEDDDYYEDDV